MENTNNQISLQEAIDMTTNYRANRPTNFPYCETFNADAINSLLALEGCTSIRIYLGMKEDENVDLILVAVNAHGEDILPNAANAAVTGDGGIIIEDGYRCPPGCPVSPLYGN